MGDISQEINNYLNKHQEQMEERVLGKLLFGAIGGSVSLGLANAGSDIDFYLIVSGSLWEEVKVLKERMNSIEVDLIILDISIIQCDMDNYRPNAKGYPSCFYRSKEQEVAMNKRDMEREGFARDVFIRVLLSDKLWEASPGIFKQCYGLLKKSVSLLELMDYHYIRAYGNYINKIEGKEEVPLRKYLYVLHQIHTCQWILWNRSKPPMDFKVLSRIQRDERLQTVYKMLVDKNNSGTLGKKKMKEKKIQELNTYINSSLLQLKEDMESNDTELLSMWLEA